MSLLDDVSIVVTPNGYKAGELYAVIPVPTEGAEEVTSFTNGTTYPFTTFTTSGNNITSAIVSSAFAGTASNGISVTLGKIYKVTFDYTKNSGDDLRVLFAVSANGAASAISNSVIISESGTYTEYFTITSTTTGYLQMGTGNSGHSLNVSISNVSAKEYTSADMDVTRATAATRVDENGLVNYAEVIGGELVNCVSFDCADPAAVWSEGSGWSFSGGKAIYDGTGGTSGLIQSNVIEVGKQYKVIVEVLSNQGSGSNTLYLGGTILSSSHLSVGTHTFYGATSNTNVSLYIYGRSGEVFEIGSFSVKEVTRDNVPRIDYTGGGCPHILAEPQRTNIITYSEAFDNAYWTKAGATVVSGFLSPKGDLSAFKLVESTNTGGHNIRKNSLPTVLTNTYTISVIAKKAERDWIMLRDDLNPSSSAAWFDLTNGVIGANNAISSNIESLGNGFYRCSVTSTPVHVSATMYPAIHLAEADNVYLYTGNGTSGIYIYGGSLEVGSYPTSYIPTSGSTVTRNQDIFTRDGIGSLINSTEGVLFLEIAALSNDGTYRQISLSDGTADNRVTIGLNATSNEVAAQVRSGGFFSMNKASAMTQTNLNKVAVKWKVNDMAIWLNGSEVEADLSGAAPVGLNQLTFDRGDGTNDFYGKVKQLQVYDTSLSDTQLAALTS